MTALDETIVRRKSEQLRAYVRYLEEFRVMSQEQFLADHHHYALAEHYLEHAVETTLDIARSLVASLMVPMPDEAYALFDTLAEHHVLPRGFAEQHVQMVGLRNRLVHEYATVDHAKVHQYLRDHLEVFEEFLRHVGAYVKSAPST